MTQQVDSAIAETFRQSMNIVRHFHAHISEHIARDPRLTEQERLERLEEIAATNRTFDTWDQHLERLVQEGMARDTRLALIMMGKQLRAGIEDW